MLKVRRSSTVTRLQCCSLLLSLYGLAPTALSAQPGATDVGEVSGFGGGSFGLGTHPVVGAASGYAFSRYAMGLLEVSYTALQNDTLRHRDPGMTPQDSHLFDFNFGFHIRVPVRDRWAPYGIVAGGILFDSFQAVTGPQGALLKIDDFKFGFHTGGGVRYYIREDWGIRPEFRVIISTRKYTRFSVGVFYNLPPEWP
jgi:hypothetical protein